MYGSLFEILISVIKQITFSHAIILLVLRISLSLDWHKATVLVSAIKDKSNYFANCYTSPRRRIHHFYYLLILN